MRSLTDPVVFFGDERKHPYGFSERFSGSSQVNFPLGNFDGTFSERITSFSSSRV